MPSFIVYSFYDEDVGVMDYFGYKVVEAGDEEEARIMVTDELVAWAEETGYAKDGEETVTQQLVMETKEMKGASPAEIFVKEVLLGFEGCGIKAVPTNVTKFF